MHLGMCLRVCLCVCMFVCMFVCVCAHAWGGAVTAGGQRRHTKRGGRAITVCIPHPVCLGKSCTACTYGVSLRAVLPALPRHLPAYLCGCLPLLCARVPTIRSSLTRPRGASRRTRGG